VLPGFVVQQYPERPQPIDKPLGDEADELGGGRRLLRCLLVRAQSIRTHDAPRLASPHPHRGNGGKVLVHINNPYLTPVMRQFAAYRPCSRMSTSRRFGSTEPRSRRGFASSTCGPQRHFPRDRSPAASRPGWHWSHWRRGSPTRPRRVAMRPPSRRIGRASSWRSRSFARFPALLRQARRERARERRADRT
jgi:hypothetical protein